MINNDQWDFWHWHCNEGATTRTIILLLYHPSYTLAFIRNSIFES